MLKKHKKKFAIIAILIFAISFFSSSISYATGYNPIPSTDAYDRDTMDQVHGGDGTEIYTIEDIVYNRVPALDVNVFSPTAGGKTVEDGSIIKFIRDMVARWYVSFRNLSIIAVAILIVYTGIKMSLSTIAEQKAQYKKQLIGWIESLAAVLAIHFIIIFLMYANQAFIDLLQATTSGEASVYNTIKTRAYDLRFSVGMPAAIMYIALILIWLRFLWTYAKRFFQTIILIIIAPFVGVKVAWDMSNGRGTIAFRNWFYELWTNVFIQSVHALGYTVLMHIAMNLALKSIAGFILALVFMHMILEFDDVFMNIFRFGDKDPASRAAGLKSSFRSDMASIITFQAARRTAAAYAGVGGKIGTAVGSTSRYAGRRLNDRMRRNSKTGRSAFDDMHDQFIDWENKRDQKKLDKLTDNRNEELEYLNRRNDELAELIKLRMNARKAGEIGNSSRKVIKLRKDNRRRTFTARANFMKNVAVGTAEAGLAIPMAVAGGLSAGVLTGVKAYGDLMDSASQMAQAQGYHIAKQNDMLKEYRKYGKIPENEEKFDNIPGAIKNLNKANALLEDIEKQVNQISDKKLKEKVLSELKDVANTPGNQEQIKVILENFATDYEKTLHEKTPEDLMRVLLKKVDRNSTLSDEVKKQIGVKSRGILSEVIKDDLETEEARERLASEMTKLISKCKMEEGFSDVGENMFAVMDLNDKATKQTSSRLIDTNQFVNGLIMNSNVGIEAKGKKGKKPNRFS